jgi:hypothetical protein
MQETDALAQTPSGLQASLSMDELEPADAQAWADAINTHHEQAVEAIVATGRALVAAKKALKQHGGWLRLFGGGPLAVARPVRFSLGTAERLMKIAQHPELSKSAHAPILPPSWYTLYELTKLPDRLVAKALADGRIHPDMERADVRALEGKGNAQSKKQPKQPGGKDQTKDGPPDELQRLRRQVVELATQNARLATQVRELEAAAARAAPPRTLAGDDGAMLSDALAAERSVLEPRWRMKGWAYAFETVSAHTLRMEVWEPVTSRGAEP